MAHRRPARRPPSALVRTVVVGRGRHGHGDPDQLQQGASRAPSPHPPGTAWSRSAVCWERSASSLLVASGSGTPAPESRHRLDAASDWRTGGTGSTWPTANALGSGTIRHRASSTSGRPSGYGPTRTAPRGCPSTFPGPGCLNSWAQFRRNSSLSWLPSAGGLGTVFRQSPLRWSRGSTKAWPYPRRCWTAASEAPAAGDRPEHRRRRWPTSRAFARVSSRGRSAQTTSRRARRSAARLPTSAGQAPPCTRDSSRIAGSATRMIALPRFRIPCPTSSPSPGRRRQLLHRGVSPPAGAERGAAPGPDLAIRSRPRTVLVRTRRGYRGYRRCEANRRAHTASGCPVQPRVLSADTAVGRRGP